MKSTFQYWLIHDLSSPNPSLDRKLNILIIQTFDDEVSRLIPRFTILIRVRTFKLIRKVTSFNFRLGQVRFLLASVT